MVSNQIIRDTPQERVQSVSTWRCIGASPNSSSLPELKADNVRRIAGNEFLHASKGMSLDPSPLPKLGPKDEERCSDTK